MTRIDPGPASLAVLATLALLAPRPAVGAALPTATEVVEEAASAGSFSVLVPSCPEGETPVSGGTASTDPQNVPVAEHAPGFGGAPPVVNAEGPKSAPDAFFSAVSNEDVSDETHVAGAICVDAAVPTSGAVQREPVGADSFGTRAVGCPGDGVVVGGGASPDDLLNVVVTRSTPRFGDVPLRLSQGPLQGPESWTVAVRNDDTEGQEFATAVVCQERDDVSAVISHSTVMAGPGTIASHQVACPGGAVAISGGVDVQNVVDQVVVGSEPVIDGSPLFATAPGRRPPPTAWLGTVRNDSSEEKDFAVTVVCVPEPGAAGGLASLGALAALAATVRRRA